MDEWIVIGRVLLIKIIYKLKVVLITTKKLLPI